MSQYIDKDKVVAEIERRLWLLVPKVTFYQQRVELEKLLSFIETLEVKDEVEDKFERPNIKIKDVVEVSSRLQHIDEELKPIAEFIMDYASWNLHKDEWNHPVLEVPLFRVLDALAQKGKPYCCC